MSDSRIYDVGPGFVRAKECPDCFHTRCGEDCVCNCDAAHAEYEASFRKGREERIEVELNRLRSALQAAEREVQDLRATTTGPAWDKYHNAVTRAERAEREAERLGAERDKAKKEWQSCWEKVQRQAVNLTALNEKVARQGARNAEMLTSLAERTQERDAARAEATELRAEVERLRGALAWYADPNQWNGYYGNTDNGKRAREALGK